LATFACERRTKEIGLRKVNGASINQIILWLNKSFLKWVIIAFILACPFAFYLTDKWLDNFAYQTSFNWWIIILAGSVALILALLTVSWQSYRAARTNPAETLQYE